MFLLDDLADQRQRMSDCLSCETPNEVRSSPRVGSNKILEALMLPLGITLRPMLPIRTARVASLALGLKSEGRGGDDLWLLSHAA